MNLQHATAGAAVSTSGVGLGYRDPSLARPVAERAGWQEIDVRAVDTARLLAADAVQKAGSGHPGTAMSLAPLAAPVSGALCQEIAAGSPAAQSVDATRRSHERQSDQSTSSTQRCQPCQSEGAAMYSPSSGLVAIMISVQAMGVHLQGT